MKLIAETEDGYLIEATENEVKEMLRAVMGKLPDPISIGQKIPAVDYAETIRRLQKLPEGINYSHLIKYGRQFTEYLTQLEKAVMEAAQNPEL